MKPALVFLDSWWSLIGGQGNFPASGLRFVLQHSFAQERHLLPCFRPRPYLEGLG